MVTSKTNKLGINEIEDLGLLKHGSGRVNGKWVDTLVGYVNMLKF